MVRKQFIGFGDPVLIGTVNTSNQMAMKAMFKGIFDNVDKLRQLPRLPGTAEELYFMADALDADKKSIYLQGSVHQVTKIKKCN